MVIDSIQLGTGVVKAWCPSLNRTPDLYRIEYNEPHESFSEDITHDELMLAIAAEKKRLATCLSPDELFHEKEKLKLHHSNLRQSADEALKEKILQILPQLCVVAAWELKRESEWKKIYERLLSQRGSDSSGGMNSNKHLDLPKYYGTRHPTSYYRDLYTNISGVGRITDGHSDTPVQIIQRMKLGCSLAWNYFQKLREKELGISLEPKRRSTRAVNQQKATGPTEILPPTEYEFGGRVANFLLNIFSVDSNPTTGYYSVSSNHLSDPTVYFDPPDMRIIEFLGKNGFSSSGITPSDIQKAMLKIIVDNIIVTVNESDNTEVVLACVSGETPKVLKSLDPVSFNRCRFQTKSLTPQQQKSNGGDNGSNHQIKPADIEENKQFEIWRYISVHTGSTIWPSWTEYVTEVLSKVKAQKESSTELSEQNLEQIKEDEAVAASLADEQPSQRRSRRSAQSADSGNLVFYGSGSSLTQSQLKESIFRLIQKSHPGGVSCLDLCRLVDLSNFDSSWKKVRLALGKLLFREGSVSRMCVRTTETDSPCQMLLSSDNDEGNCLIEPALEDFEEKEEDNSMAVDQKDGGDEVRASDSPLISQYYTKEHVEQLKFYIRELHLTEMKIRSILVNTTQLQVDLDKIAASADEDATIDAIGEDAQNDIEWESQGHDLLNTIIMRPGGEKWKVEKYLKPEYAEEEDVDTTTTTSSTRTVTRRTRFLIVRYSDGNQSSMIVTEAQVRAGIEALQFSRSQESAWNLRNKKTHPFAYKVGMLVNFSIVDEQNQSSGSSDDDSRSMASLDGSDMITATVAGFDDGENKNEDGGPKVLLSLDEYDQITSNGQSSTNSNTNSSSQNAKKNLLSSFWATILEDESGENSDSFIYFLDSMSKTVKARLVFTDYDAGSDAFNACEEVLAHMKAHQKAEPFLHPVDPEALGIPEYFDIIKNPMDFSTVEKNLFAGKYSKSAIQNASSSNSSSEINPVKNLVEGEFKDDLLLIFNNAMSFNPKSSWIYQDALHLQRLVIKKIEAVVRSVSKMKGNAETNVVSSSNPYSRVRKSKYTEDSDSAVDEAYLESEDEELDDEFFGTKRKSNNKKKKRRKNARMDNFDGDTTFGASVTAEKVAARAIETPQDVPEINASFSSLRHVSCFLSFNINTDANTFSLPTNWLCRPNNDHTHGPVNSSIAQNQDKKVGATVDKEEAIFNMMESNIRRSARGSRNYDETDSGGIGNEGRATTDDTESDFVYFPSAGDLVKTLMDKKLVGHDPVQIQNLTKKYNGSTGAAQTTPFSKLEAFNRIEVESILEKMHEAYFAKVFHDTSNSWRATKANNPAQPSGVFVDNSFPPYLGRISGGKWEIRAPYVLPALRWILRGLVRSGHLGEVNPLTMSSSESVVVSNPSSLAPTATSAILKSKAGTVVVSNMYYWNHEVKPFDLLDVKKAPKQKKKSEIEEEQEREKDANRELSEYERIRLERVQRNKEKLKALGLA